MRLKVKMLKSRIAAAFLLMLVAIMLVVYTGATLTKSSAETVSLQSEEIKSVYFVGERFTAPDSVEITLNGQSVTATDAVIRFPDGTVRVNGTYTLKDVGMYSIEYSFIHKDQKYKATQTFNVTEYKSEFNNDALSVQYGDLTMSAGAGKQETGLTISLSEGDEFTFKAPFNVNDSQWANICRIYPIPVEDIENVASCINNHPEGFDRQACRNAVDSVKFVVVRVTDCYDSNNYIEVLINNNLMTKYNYSPETARCDSIYTMARSSASEDWVGLRKATNITSSTIIYEDQYYYRDTTTLDFVHTSYGGRTYGNTNLYTFAEQGGFNFSYNEQTKQVKFNSTKSPESDNQMVNDLDSPAIYGDELFEGFTTGEVYISIYCSGYRKNLPQQIEIASLLGVEGEELNNLVIDDKTAPLIKTKLGLDNGDALYVSKNEVFTAPEVEVYDLNFKDLKVNCYANYGTANESIVYMSDNKFTPTHTGKYTLVYSATDTHNNISKFILNLYCVDRPSFTVGEINVQDISINNGVCELPDVSVQGLNGAVETTIYVVDPKGNKFIANNGEFDIKYTGEYSLEYIFADGIYSTCKKTTFTNETKIGFFLDKICVNNYYINSVKYTIDDYFVYICDVDGLKAKRCDIFVSSDGGEFVAVPESECDAYTVTATNTLQFKYKFGEQEILSDIVDVVNVVSDDSVDYTKYFITPFEITKNLQNYTFTTQKDGTIEFINPISVLDFLLELEFTEANSNFSVFNIYLEDYSSKQSVKLSFKKNEKRKLSFAMNDGKYTSTQIDFCSSYKVYYSGGKFLSNLGEEVSFDANGFDAKIAYLKIELVGVQGTSSVVLKKINNQAFRDNLKESVPVFIMTEKSKFYNIGDRYVIDIPTVNSVLSPVLKNNLTVTVLDDNGDPVKDINGKLLYNAIMDKEYIFELTLPGIYVVKYTAVVEGLLKQISTESKPIALNVADNIKPEIYFNGNISEGHVEHVKTGEKHIILPYTVSDNYSSVESMKIRIAIYKTDRNSLLDYGEFTEYTFKNPGTYTVKVVCFDEYGNQARVSYTVVVE